MHLKNSATTVYLLLVKEYSLPELSFFYQATFLPVGRYLWVTDLDKNASNWMCLIFIHIWLETFPASMKIFRFPAARS